MSSFADDLVFAIAVCTAGEFYYIIRASLYRDRYFPIRTPERKFRPSSHKLEVVVNETLGDNDRAPGDVWISRGYGESGGGEPITADEWIDVVESDLDLKTIRELAPFPVKIRSKKGMGSTVLTLQNGGIHAEKPTMQEIVKMCAIAEKLGATVFDDEGTVIIDNGKITHAIGKVPCELPSGATYYYKMNQN